MDIIKKIVAFSTVLCLAFFGLFGYTDNISDDYKEYKNVILMIGDGMGENTVAATKAQKGVELAMETMPVRGQSETKPFVLWLTDSAAGGTALSCGVRVWDNSVGVFPFSPIDAFDVKTPISLVELAKDNGKAAGVVTTDKTSGATPASFTAHVMARSMEGAICKDQLASDVDLLWGAQTDSINETNCAENGFTYVSTATQLEALDSSSRSIAQFSFDDLKNCKNDHDTPSITEMTTKAIDILNTDEDGFFLMVEGACIDKFSHDNEFEGATTSLVEFDKAVEAALDFAKADGETLVVVTADHETGGIKYNSETDEYYYTTDNHTNANVPLFVSAEDAGFSNGEAVKNSQIGVQIARVLGYGESQFPAVRVYSGESSSKINISC